MAMAVLAFTAACSRPGEDEPVSLETLRACGSDRTSFPAPVYPLVDSRSLPKAVNTDAWNVPIEVARRYLADAGVSPTRLEPIERRDGPSPPPVGTSAIIGYHASAGGGEVFLYSVVSDSGVRRFYVTGSHSDAARWSGIGDTVNMVAPLEFETRLEVRSRLDGSLVQRKTVRRGETEFSVQLPQRKANPCRKYRVRLVPLVDGAPGGVTDAK